MTENSLLEATDAIYLALSRRNVSHTTLQRLVFCGRTTYLSLSKTALFCSTRCPGNVILAAYNQASRWRDEGRCVIGGFHSPIERECLRILLRGSQPVIVCLARGLEGMRMPAEWKKPLADGRLLIASPFAASERRVTRKLAVERNRIVAALADEIVFAHLALGGELDRLRHLVTDWGVPYRVLSEEASMRPAHS